MRGREPRGERELEAAVTAGLATIQRRERTVAELRAWLLERGTDADVVEAALAELIEVGELDDERFAFAFAGDKRELAGWGAERIEGALTDRGLDRELVDRASAEGRDSQLDRAATQLRRRGEPLDGDRERARALSYLTRRGYEYELAYDAIRVVERDVGSAA